MSEDHGALNFERTTSSYALAIDDTKFLDLLDSESYVSGNAALQSGNTTLGDKLDRLDGVSDVEYDGHFGGYVYLTIGVDQDNDETRREISRSIVEHLSWCGSLPKTPHVAARRAAES